MIPANVNPLMMAGGADPLDEYRVIGHSVRTRAAATGYLTRTFGAGGDRTKWTYSRWVKRTKFGIQQPLFYVAGAANDTDYLFIEFDLNDKLSVVTGLTYFRTSNRIFRDPSSHFMVTVAVDTNHVTANSRIRVYIDDEEITSWAAITNPALGANMGVNQALAHEIGRAEAAYYFDGYNSEIRFVNAQQLDPSSFGVRHPKTNQWRPKAYSGAYGTNGFYLDFSDGSAATAAALGADRSGNGNNWTPTNISVTAGVGQDWMLDTPTNNHPIFNQLVSIPSNGAYTLTEGGVNFSPTGAEETVEASLVASMSIPLTGAWQWETTPSVVAVLSSTRSQIGVMSKASINRVFATDPAAGNYAYVSGGSKFSANVPTAYGASYAASDVIGCVFDSNAGTLTFYKNGVSQGVAFSGLNASNEFFPAVGYWGTFNVNFGQRPFVYPVGAAKPLCTKNLVQTSTVTVSGTFTGNALADGPFVWMNGTPTTLTINGNAVTFGTHADALANGFKLRTSSASYNTAGSNTWTATIVSNIKNIFRHQNARGN